MLPGFAMLVERVIFLFHSLEAQGTIIGYEGIDDSQERMLTPKFEFVDGGGRLHRVVWGVGQSSPPEIGTRVRVRYNARYPHEARILTMMNYWLPPCAIWFFGFLIYLAILHASGAWAARPDMAKWALPLLLGCPLIVGGVGVWKWRQGGASTWGNIETSSR